MASRRLELLLLLGAFAFVAGNEQTTDPSTCTLQQDEVCYPKCLPTCTAERDGCPEGSQCTPEARTALQQQDRQCVHSCMLDCFKTNSIEPQCRKPEPETANQLSEEEAKKAAEKAERKRKKKEEKERKKREKELANSCGSCYGAEDHSPSRNGCCNSCDEVRRAYEVWIETRRYWHIP